MPLTPYPFPISTGDPFGHRDRLHVKSLVDVAHNFDSVDRFFVPTYVNHGGIIPDLIHGSEAVGISVARYRAAFPGLSINVDELRADGDFVTMKWTARNKRALRRPCLTTSTDKSDNLMGRILIRIANGKIAESWMALS